MRGIRGGRAPHRRARSTVLTVLTALTLVLTTTATSQAQQAPDEKPRQIGTVSTTGKADAAPPATRTSPFPKSSGKDCEPTRPGSKERKAGATQACLTIGAAPATQQQRDGVAAADTGTCTVTPGTYSYGRFSYCVGNVNVLYQLIDSNGVPVGSATLKVSTSASLSAQATTWKEQVSVTMTESNNVPGLLVKFYASCGNTAGTDCKATTRAPWYSNTPMVLDVPRTGEVAYAAYPAAGGAVEFLTQYKMYVTSPDATTVDPNASWDNPRTIRCDNAVGGTTPAGCVVPSETAVVPMSATASDPGGAVAAYEWAQKNLSDRWGDGKLLTRAVAGVSARTAATCTGFSVVDGIVVNDTCADFPFGEAQEGGISGDRCVEVVPNLANGGWNTYALGDARYLDKSSPCMKAHVTPGEKQFAETQLAQGFADQRVIDADQFKLKLSAADAGLSAGCLTNVPTDAILNTNLAGWKRYTTENVPQVNKTTTPNHAGLRPTRAQACLVANVPRGTDAYGEITGWGDAQVQNNNSTTGLARCHLIANVLGGTGQVGDRGQENLVPCWQSGMNTLNPSMRTFEALAEGMIKSTATAPAPLGPGDAVFYEVTPVYRDKTSTIPVGVTMRANIEWANGTIQELFPNVYVPNTKRNSLQNNLGN